MKEHESVIFSKDHKFLEGLRWHDGHLWASDFFTKSVKRLASDGSSFETIAEIAGAPSGLGFLDDGSILVVSQADATIRRLTTGGSDSLYADFSSYAGGIGNDMIVTNSGHAYVGNFGFALGAEDPRPTHLVHVDPTGIVESVGGDVLFPNGMAITPDSVLLLAETWNHRITAFDIVDDGSLANQRVWAQLDESLHPDDIALDTDGGVWFGNALTLAEDSGFYRVIEGGEITDKVPVPGAWAVSCTFGGNSLDTLYMSCNTTTLDEFHEGHSSARITTANVGRRGAPSV
ncbi:MULTISPECIES: SMP-30/gluconolactonase/LRE family protein [unclassified Rhodococcus (in: high G+C Gram-positive bacteria)]|uniref:SMP-30/gluconolactonase/LRE family protein n=1 Tax=unclassified Rhodococcus (in: high G+C Gram-positive bacteria) TaxID=192944 RepID=UPI00163A9031|nr:MULTISPECIES: SMP-30/gluconolactonase/LRE family protein [unclassified Rhodococcus (in: high G+C Gram-positive bacteria)]MBC2640759.1 SMP-30/gluconolactonase/LRE family protein [Rhodococcus sp. 3A]MBC2894496.1 SMP-30/gluconolactonase/LRE family protein [Rhodococcus sp. 4CII]